MFVLDYYLFVNVLRFCDKSHLFPLLLTCKRLNKISWIYLIDFLKINLSEIFVNNCRNGNLDCVKFLTKDSRVDPNSRNNLSIIWASNYGHLEVVKLLLQDHRINEEIKEIYRKKHNL